MSEKSRAHNSAGRPSCQDRPQQDSQTAFSAMVRCTSVRRCLIRALIKSQNRERERGGGREKERENLCVCVCVRACMRACMCVLSLRLGASMILTERKGMHWENRKGDRKRERARRESLIYSSRRGRINYLRGDTTIGHDRISIWIAVIALMELDSSTRMRERAFSPHTEKLKSQHELHDRISSEFSIGVPD